MKRSKSFMPREENRREMEYEAPTSSQRDSEVSNSYTGPESNPQDNKVSTHIYFFSTITQIYNNLRNYQMSRPVEKDIL